MSSNFFCSDIFFWLKLYRKFVYFISAMTFQRFTVGTFISSVHYISGFVFFYYKDVYFITSSLKFSQIALVYVSSVYNHLRRLSTLVVPLKHQECPPPSFSYLRISILISKYYFKTCNWLLVKDILSLKTGNSTKLHKKNLWIIIHYKAGNRT